MPKRRQYWPPPPPPQHGQLALRTYDEDAPARADAYRRRHKSYHEMCGPGGRPKSWEALDRLNKILVPCGSCATLTAWPKALNAARRAGHSAIQPAAGCAAKACSRSAHHQRARHAAQQHRWAAQLVAGERTLVQRPTHADQPAADLITGTQLTAAIAAAMAALPAPPH